MDDLTKNITETNQKIIEVLNESQLHPMILKMMLNDIQHQIDGALRNVPKGETENDHTDI